MGLLRKEGRATCGSPQTAVFFGVGGWKLRGGGTTEIMNPICEIFKFGGHMGFPARVMTAPLPSSHFGHRRVDPPRELWRKAPACSQPRSPPPLKFYIYRLNGERGGVANLGYSSLQQSFWPPEGWPPPCGRKWRPCARDGAVNPGHTQADGCGRNGLNSCSEFRWGISKQSLVRGGGLGGQVHVFFQSWIPIVPLISMPFGQ